MAYRVWVMLMFDAVVYRARGALVRNEMDPSPMCHD